MSRQYGYQYRAQHSPRERITWAVQWLILANCAVFAAQLLLNAPLGMAPPAFLSAPPSGEVLLRALAFNPDLFLRGFVWQSLTYMFLHGGLMHLFFNMLWLFIFGPEVERLLGSRQFLRFYLVCGVLGVLASYVGIVLTRQAHPVIGASGATMGVLIAFAMANPAREFFLFPLPIPITARGLVAIVIAVNLVNALRGGGGTSVSTHFGGMAVGFAYMKFIPMWRSFWTERDRRRRQRKLDQVGEAVDNIFEFDKEKRRRR